MMRTSRSEARERNRASLLAAAIDLVAEHGYDASLDAITERAGMTTGAVYSLFGSKAKLYAALLDELAHWFLQVFEPLAEHDTDLESALHETGRRHHALLTDAKMKAQISFELEVTTRALRDEALLRRIMAVYAEQHNQVRAMLVARPIARNGKTITDAQADRLTTALFALLRGLAQSALIHPHPRSARMYPTLVASLASLVRP